MDQHTNFHIVIGNTRDRKAAAEACAIDAPADRRWFAEHPNETRRERLASPRELRADELPLGTMVTVVKLADGTIARLISEPNGEQN